MIPLFYYDTYIICRLKDIEGN